MAKIGKSEYECDMQLRYLVKALIQLKSALFPVRANLQPSASHVLLCFIYIDNNVSLIFLW